VKNTSLYEKKHYYNFYKGEITMTVRQRIMAIQLMEKMEKAHKNGDENIIKKEDGTLVYQSNGNELFSVSMKEKA
jgi:hypothetical protein